MSLPAHLSAAILETVLTGLAALFLAGADSNLATARQAATEALEAYHPQSEDELRLIAIIISFSFRALEALGQAAAPELPLTRMLRLHGSAVSLSREAAKAERRLAQLRKDAQPAKPEQSANFDVAQPEPKIAPAPPPIQPTGKIAALAKANDVSWSKAYEDRQRDLRIAASLKRAEARVAAQSAATIIQEHGPMAVAV